MSKKLKFLAMVLIGILLSTNLLWSQAAVGTTLYAEDFSAYSEDDVPSGSITNSHTGTTVYSGTLTYSCVNGTYTSSGKTKTAYTKIYEATTGGGTSPELLIGKNAGTFSISSIPTGSATELTITFKSNKNPKLSSGTTGVTFGSTQPTKGDGNVHTTTITIPSNTSAFNLTFTAPNDNARLDDISIVVKTAGSSGTNYTLGYSVSPTGKADVALGSTSLAKDATTTATYSNVATGYEFLYWSISGTGASLSNADGGHSTDNPVTVTMGTANATVTANLQCITPTISVDPSNGSAVQGSSPTPLTVTASGGSLSYQWKQCATSGGTYVNVTGGSGANSESYSPPTSSVGTMYYKCEVTNTGSSCNTTATSNYASFEVTAPTPATITLQNYDGDATTTGYYSGGSFTLPSENDFVCGDLTFVGWSSVTIDNSATKPSAATYHEPGESVTLGASNTFYAVFAEASGGGTSANSISSYEDGTYYMIDSIVLSGVPHFYSPTGTASGKVPSVDLTDYVSVTNGVLTLDLTCPSLAAEMQYSISYDSETEKYIIYNSTNGNYIGSATGKTDLKTTNDNNWTLAVSDKKFRFLSAGADGRLLLYQHTYDNTTGGGHSETATRQFGHYTKSNAGKKGDYEKYGSGYFFLVPTTGGTSYSNYTTNCVNMRTIYLDAYHFGDTDGAKFAIYSWRNADASDNKLSDAFMTKVEDCYYGHLYEGEMPDNHDRVIFLRNASAAASPVKDGANKLNQTVDITTEANKDFFTIASGGAGNAYTGSWGVYTPNYAVTFDKNGVTSTSTWPSDQCIAEGGKVTDPNITPLAMGKTFVGWYQEAEGTNAWVFNTNTVSAATTIYAKWNDVATKTIYLDTDFGDGDDNKWDKANVVIFAHAYIDGTSIYTDVKATSAISSCQPHVYAFTIPGNADYVTFARCATGATSIIWDGGSKNVYNQVSLPVQASKDYYLITGWGSDGVSTGRLETTTFTPVSYTITYNEGTNGSGSRDSESKLCGVAFTLPNSQVFTRNGYTMNGWATSDGGDKIYDLGESYTTDANLNLYPHWTEATYSVTLTTNGGTINAGNVTSYTYGTGATLPTDVTKAHATFQGWYASSTFEGDRVYTIGTTEYGNKQYYAKWEDVKWTVTWKANGATVRTDANIVDGNKVASVPSAPSDLTTGSNGCDAEFVGWVIEANDPGALSISSQSSTPSGMFTNVAGSPAITGNTTFIAIYRQEQ